MNTAHLYRFVFIIVGLMIFFLVASVSAQTAVLQGTIRDFNDTHIDFENAVGLDPGIVLSLLGNDNLPVYAGLTGTLTTHGQEAFDQWYRDTPGINLPMPYSITLTPTGTPGESAISIPALRGRRRGLIGSCLGAKSSRSIVPRFRRS